MRVFVVQNQRQYDLTDAERYGEVIELVDEASPNPKEYASAVINQMKRDLADFSDADFLLPMGSPVLIGWATAIAAQANGGTVRMLQWSGAQRAYQEMTATELV